MVNKCIFSAFFMAFLLRMVRIKRGADLYSCGPVYRVLECVSLCCARGGLMMWAVRVLV